MTSWRQSMVARRLRTPRDVSHAVGARAVLLGRRAAAKRTECERRASACIEHGWTCEGARLYASALHHYRRAARLLGYDL